MKQIRPGTLRPHLAQDQAAGSHPDADLLTALAENTLLERERTDVLAHLAACSDCRAIVHTAAAAEPEPESEPAREPFRERRPFTDPIPASTSQIAPVAAAMPARSPIPAAASEPGPARPRFLTWLPGFALAASLLVIIASTVIFYRVLHSTPAQTQTAAATPAPRLPSGPSATSAPLISAANSAPTAAPAALKHTRASSHVPASAPLPAVHTEEARIGDAAPPPAVPEAGASSHVSLGDLAQTAQNAPSAEQGRMHAQMQSEILPYHGAMAKAAPRSPVPESSTESVQVAPSPTFLGALKTTRQVAGFIPVPTPRPRFRISDSGGIERSVESSIWMPVPIVEGVRFRVLSSFGDDVWAGGDHLRLFHSSDNGLTWTEVQLPVAADRTHAVAHIRIDDAEHVTVEEDTGSAWTTTNAGATWQ